MNKRALVNLILSTVVLILLIKCFLTQTGLYSIYIFSIDIFIVATIFMYQRKNNIKKMKFVYDVILMLMMFFSFLILGYIFYAFISQVLNNNILDDYVSILYIVFPIFNLIIIIFSFCNLFKKTNKNNDYLSIFCSVLITVIYIRYLNMPIFNNISLNDSNFDLYAKAINQNLPYFTSLYFLATVHYFLNKVS